MQVNPPSEESLKALNDLRDIRGIMERSTRFLSLSGWSGIWAGCTALASAAVAWKVVPSHLFYRDARPSVWTINISGLLLLAVVTFVIAFCGAYFFTWRKAAARGQKMWTKASRQLMAQIAVPMIAGGIFCIAFLQYDAISFIPSTCLTFYGLALVNGSKYTLGEVRWLGYCEIALGCTALFIPYYGLTFMATGFGLLHILYGIIMWNKYDNPRSA